MKLTWSDLESAKKAGLPLNLAKPADFRKIRLAMLQETRRSQVLARYVHELNLGEQQTGTFTYHNTEPWQAIGEQQLAALHILCRATTTWHGWEVDPYKLEGPDDAAVIGALLCLRATSCLWPLNIEQIATASEIHEAFELTRETCPWSEGLFVSRETCLLLVDDTKPDTQLVTNWLLVVPLADQLTILFDLGDPATQQTMISALSYKYGALVDSDYLHIFRMMAFMQSPYVGTTRHYLPRHLRRGRQNGPTPRDQKAEPPSAIQVELLRRRSTQAPSQANHKEIDWQHQWWVRGHYRVQKHSKKLSYVRPYLKGPEDKPVLQHIYKVGR